MSILIVWNNHAYGSHAYPGHAALSIDEGWKRTEQQKSYVSWWPKASAEGEQDKGSRAAAPNLSFGLDLQCEGYAPDHILELDGLNEQAMQAKWNRIKDDPQKKYTLLRHNCANIVSQVLKEGSNKGSVVDRHSVVWTPLKVLRLAKAMGGQEITWNEFLTRLHMGGWLIASDVKVLSQLYKRDEKHGKNATDNLFYYSEGRSVNPKTYICFKNFKVGKQGANVQYFKSEEGSVFSSGMLSPVNGTLYVQHEEVSGNL